MLEAFIISSDNRFHTLMILTEKRASTLFYIYSSIWHNKLKRIASSYFNMTNSEKVVLG